MLSYKVMSTLTLQYNMFSFRFLLKLPGINKKTDLGAWVSLTYYLKKLTASYARGDHLRHCFKASSNQIKQASTTVLAEAVLLVDCWECPGTTLEVVWHLL